MAVEWGRLTRHAKRAVVESQELAAALGSPSVQPDHLMMTLIDDPASTAVLLLCLADSRPDEVKCALEDRLADAAEAAIEKPPYSPAVRELVQKATQLAGAGPVGTGQLLVAALEPGGEIAASLRDAGVDVVEVQAQLESLGAHELSGAATSPTVRASNDRVAESPSFPSAYPERAPAGGAANKTASATASGGAGSRTVGSGAVGAHTLQALARLVVDLSGKASKAAREHGSPALGEQLDRMRQEVEREMRAAAPGSRPGPPGSKEKSA